MSNIYSAAQTSLINDSFNTMYFLLKKTYSLNALAIEFANRGKNIEDLERVLKEADEKLTVDLLREYNNLGHDTLGRRLMIDFPEIFDPHYSEDWQKLGFKGILRLLFLTGDYKMIREYFNTTRHAEEHDIVFFRDFTDLVLSKCNDRGNHGANNLPQKFISELDRRHFSRDTNRRQRGDDVNFYHKTHAFTFIQPHQNGIRNFNNDFVNSSLGWSDTIDGSDFWSAFSTESKDKFKELNRTFRAEQYPGVAFTEMIDALHAPQININNEIPVPYVEPLDLILGEPADLSSII